MRDIQKEPFIDLAGGRIRPLTFAQRHRGVGRGFRLRLLQTKAAASTKTASVGPAKG